MQAIIDKFKLKSITIENLAANGLISKNDRVKILGGGELSAKVDVTVHAISASAKAVIEEKGGTINLV